jgi:hypothetical protein
VDWIAELTKLFAPLHDVKLRCGIERIYAALRSLHVPRMLSLRLLPFSTAPCG